MNIHNFCEIPLSALFLRILCNFILRVHWQRIPWSSQKLLPHGHTGTNIDLHAHLQPLQQWSSGDVGVPLGMITVPQQSLRVQQRVQYVASGDMHMLAGPYAYGPAPQYIDHQDPNQYGSVQYETYQLADGSIVQQVIINYYCSNSPRRSHGIYRYDVGVWCHTGIRNRKSFPEFSHFFFFQDRNTPILLIVLPSSMMQHHAMVPIVYYAVCSHSYCTILILIWRL